MLGLGQGTAAGERLFEERVADVVHRVYTHVGERGRDAAVYERRAVRGIERHVRGGQQVDKGGDLVVLHPLGPEPPAQGHGIAPFIHASEGCDVAWRDVAPVEHGVHHLVIPQHMEHVATVRAALVPQSLEQLIEADRVVTTVDGVAGAHKHRLATRPRIMVRVQKARGAKDGRRVRIVAMDIAERDDAARLAHHTGPRQAQGGQAQRPRHQPRGLHAGGDVSGERRGVAGRFPPPRRCRRRFCHWSSWIGVLAAASGSS